MDKGLFIQAITKFSVGLVLVGLLLFLPAGSLHYWQARLLIAILFVPMYMATTVLFLTMPLVLASPISFFIMLGYLPVIVKRIRNEEKVLEEGLEGYSEYKKKVKYRIIPLIW